MVSKITWDLDTHFDDKQRKNLQQLVNMQSITLEMEAMDQVLTDWGY